MERFMSKQSVGKIGEDLGASWLTKKGFIVLDRNWRHGRHEMDLIAIKDGCLHFIEIKTRRNLAFGWPEENITSQKILRMGWLAEAYMRNHKTNGVIQLDILSVILSPAHPPSFFFIEDVYL